MHQVWCHLPQVIMAITPDIAYRLRFERGLKLSPSAEYTVPRLKEIAIEWESLWEKLEALDTEIAEIYNNTKEQ